MRSGRRVAVVMPARNEEQLIEAAIYSVPKWVDLLVVIDDGSRDNTYSLAKSALTENGLIVRTQGLGVGGAIARGYEEIISMIDDNSIPSGDWAAVVMAGDGQMDPVDIEPLLEPLSRVPFVKGNRWAHQDGLGNMPKNRRIGSWLLSKLTTVASGRKVSDPQCGYTAVSIDELRKWDWVSNWEGYGYPNWWLLNIGKHSIPFESVPVRSVYRNEKSGIKVPLFLTKISILLFSGLWKRGWDWYVCGEGKTPIASRLAVSTTWFSSLLILLLIPAIALLKPDLMWIFFSLIGFLLLTYYIDQSEVQRRLKL